MFGSFSSDMPHNVLTGTDAGQYCDNFARVCAKLAEDGDLDLLCGCRCGDVGGGFRKAGIDVAGVLQKPFGNDMCVSEQDNYIAVWGMGGALQFAKLSLHEPASTPYRWGDQLTLRSLDLTWFRAAVARSIWSSGTSTSTQPPVS